MKVIKHLQFFQFPVLNKIMSKHFFSSWFAVIYLIMTSVLIVLVRQLIQLSSYMLIHCFTVYQCGSTKCSVKPLGVDLLNTPFKFLILQLDPQNKTHDTAK